MFSSRLSSGRKQKRTVACGFLHNSHWVFCLQCRAMWPWLRHEKHIPLDMQSSCLSLTDLPKKFLHAMSECWPLHNMHKLVSVGVLHDASLPEVARLVPCRLFLSLLWWLRLILSIEGFLCFSNSFLVEVRASCENTGWFASRDASCVNSTKFAKEYSPHLASTFFTLAFHLLL